MSQVPIRESVGAALRFVRDNVRFIAIATAIGAVASTGVSALSLAVPQTGMLATVAVGVVQAFLYAAFIGCALFGAQAASARWRADGWRVWASMVVVGLFLFIVVFVVTIPVSMALAVGPLSRYVIDLQQAGSDQNAVMLVMMRFVEENPAVILGVVLFYGIIWFLLTSRLYLAAPASVDQERILSFETWPWTKGAMLRIASARLMLLAPAYLLCFAVSTLLGRLIGIDMLSAASIQAAAAVNPVGLLAIDFVRAFIILALYASLEAGLSSYLYSGLKPVQAPPPQA